MNRTLLILSGSIIEATIIEYFLHNFPAGKTKAQVLSMSLANLIDEAQSVNLISSKSKELSTVIRNYRNLIHPGLEIRKNENFDQETAIVSYNLVKIVLKELKENYKKKYGYKAEDIFNKIELDNSTYFIYPKLLQKVNNYEQVRLMTMLIDYQIKNYETKSKNSYEKYIEPLKPLIGDEKLLIFCKDLLIKVEKGKSSHILILFKIFGQNLKLSETEEQELILTYIYNFTSRISAWNDIHMRIMG